MLPKWFDPEITWLIGRNLREVKIWINQFPEWPAINTDFKFSSNYRIKPCIASHQAIKMMCKLKYKIRFTHDLKLNKIKVVFRNSIALLSSYRVCYIEPLLVS